MTHSSRMPWYPGVSPSGAVTQPRRAARSPHGAMRWSWRVGTIAGIGIDVHVSFLLLVAWVAVAELAGGGSLASLTGALVVLACAFASVVLHELGHALVARRFGIATRDITLLPIGGVARLERMPDRPREELLVAVAGPAVNFALAAAALLAYALLPLPAPVAVLIARVAWVNLSLGLFNLLPAFPMDGGRALRALLGLRWDRVRATEAAARIGQGLAVLLGLAGLFLSPLLILVAVFVWAGARQESSFVQMQSALAGLPVGQAMVRDFHALDAADPLSRAVTLRLAGFQQDFPVLDGGHLVGLLTRGDVLRALSLGRSSTTVGKAMHGDVLVVDPEEPLDAVLERLAARDAAVVASRDGRVVGLLTPAAIDDLLMLQLALRSGARAPRP